MKWEKCGIKWSSTNRAFVWLHSLKSNANPAHIHSYHSLFELNKRKHKHNVMKSILRFVLIRQSYFVMYLDWRVHSRREMKDSSIKQRDESNQGFARAQWRADVPIWTNPCTERERVAQGHFIIHLLGIWLCGMFVQCVRYNLCMNFQTKFQHIFCSAFFHHFSVLLGFHSFCFHSK